MLENLAILGGFIASFWVVWATLQGAALLLSAFSNVVSPLRKPPYSSVTAFALIAGTVGMVFVALFSSPKMGLTTVWALYVLWPVFAALAGVMILSWIFKERLGLYGRVFDSPIGMVGLGICFFWIIAALMADLLPLYGPLEALSKDNGTIVQGVTRKFKLGAEALEGLTYAEYVKLTLAEASEYGKLYKSNIRGSAPLMSWVGNEGERLPAILGTDKANRDIFSRLIYGARTVLPLSIGATLVSFTVGITLGLIAGYRGGWLDQIITFVANAILAFPVIVLFYLIVLVGKDGNLSRILATAIFAFPLLLVLAGLWGLYSVKKGRLIGLLIVFLPIALFLYFRNTWGLPDLSGIAAWAAATFGGGNAAREANIAIAVANFAQMEPRMLNVFVAVAFSSAPGAFRLVRGLTLDVKDRDYVAAAQTRGENQFYIMIFEILPNVRGPLMVDAALRIGYTAILLGTLGFLALGLPQESADWGSMIAHGRGQLRFEPQMAVIPALCIVSLVLGLNLLADTLREQSLKD